MRARPAPRNWWLFLKTISIRGPIFIPLNIWHQHDWKLNNGEVEAYHTVFGKHMDTLDRFLSKMYIYRIQAWDIGKAFCLFRQAHKQ